MTYIIINGKKHQITSWHNDKAKAINAEVYFRLDVAVKGCGQKKKKTSDL